MSQELDLNFIRKQFPAFSQAENRKWAFFENAGGSYMAKQVIDKFTDYISHKRVQPYSPYSMSAQAGQAMDLSYQRLAELHNVDSSEIILGPSTSMNTFILASAFAKDLQKGDEIIVSNQEHEANAGSWWRLADYGIVVKEWQIDRKTGLLDIAELDNLLSDKTKLVCFTHCSNIAAAINDVKTITNKAHTFGAQVVVDGVSYAPHQIIDFKDLNVDYYLYSLYKTYGPHLGLLYAKRESLEKIANRGHFFNADKLRYKLDPAGPNHAAIAAASGVVDYYEAVYNHHFNSDASAPSKAKKLNQLFNSQEEKVAKIIIDYLLSNKDIQLIGPQTHDTSKRAPTISFRHKNMSSAKITAALTKQYIATNNGHFYAYRLIKALGIDLEDGIVRLSASHYSSVEDAKKASLALESIFGS